MTPLQELSSSREHWSYSSLNQFLNICSLQWAFQRYYQEPREFVTVNLAFGSAFHRTLEAISRHRQEQKFLTEKEARDLFADFWERQLQTEVDLRYEADQDAEKLSAQGRDLVACYCTRLDQSEEVVAINPTFCVPLIDAQGGVLEKPLLGEFDLVVKQAGQPLLVDWKTSATRWNPGKAHRALQPTLYLYGYTQTQAPGPVPEFRYDIVVKNKTPVFEQHRTTRGPDAFQRVLEKIKLAERMIASEHFYPNEEGMFCKSCPFSGACQNWHRGKSRWISVAAG